MPGTPGGAWSQEELLTVRAKLWLLYTNDYVYKLKSLFGKFGLPAPSNGIDLQFFSAKVKYKQSRSEITHSKSSEVKHKIIKKGSPSEFPRLYPLRGWNWRL